MLLRLTRRSLLGSLAVLLVRQTTTPTFIAPATAAFSEGRGVGAPVAGASELVEPVLALFFALVEALVEEAVVVVVVLPSAAPVLEPDAVVFSGFTSDFFVELEGLGLFRPWSCRCFDTAPLSSSMPTECL